MLRKPKFHCGVHRSPKNKYSVILSVLDPRKCEYVNVWTIVSTFIVRHTNVIRYYFTEVSSEFGRNSLVYIQHNELL